jgi:hypothetical protein
MRYESISFNILTRTVFACQQLQTWQPYETFGLCPVCLTYTEVSNNYRQLKLNNNNNDRNRSVRVTTFAVKRYDLLFLLGKPCSFP